MIRDLYLTDWGSRLFMFENFNGTPLQTLLSLTMKRAEFTVRGRSPSLPAAVVGIETKCDAITEYKTVADYAKAQDAGRAQDRNSQFRRPSNARQSRKGATMAKQRISYVPLEKMTPRMREEMERCQREGTPRPKARLCGHTWKRASGSSPTPGTIFSAMACSITRSRSFAGCTSLGRYSANIAATNAR